MKLSQNAIHIAILGAGKTGSNVASALSQKGYNVTVVDRDLSALHKLGRECDISTLQAEAPDAKLFEELLQNPPNLLLAATGSDETNVISCAIAKNLGFAKTAAIVHSPDYLHPRQIDLGRLFFVDHFIGADLLIAQDLFKILVHAEDIAVEHFAHGAIQMRTLAAPAQWKKKSVPLKDLDFPQDLMIGLIRRKLDAEPFEQILFPHGDDVIFPGDEITVLGQSKTMNRLHEIFGILEHPPKSVVLAGGSRAAEHLARFLCRQHISVRVIEQDLARCEMLAQNLPEATIIHRNGCDFEFLCAERVQDADALVSCTGRDETNLLIAAFAKQAGCKKAIALAQDPRVVPIAEQLGLFPAHSTRLNIINRVLAVLHDQSILSIASLCNDQAKIAELRIPHHSKAIGIPLADLSARLPKDLLIGAIETKGRVAIGRGNRILSPNDTAIVILAPQHLASLQELLCQ